MPSFTSFRPAGAVLAAVTLMLLAGGCETVPARPIAWPSTTGTAAPAAPVAVTSQLRDSFAQFRQTVSGKVGVAIVPVGSTEAIVLGDWTSGVAWSTVKVPLAVAALRKAGDTAKPAAVQAITRSDNAAADRLWKLLGTPAQAAHAVAAVLNEGGDGETAVESRVVRPGYSAFGQTVWPIASQARFVAQLPCMPGTAPVLGLMGQIAGDQRWGLGQLQHSVYKGGWGPGASGGYLVRQTGIITTARGQIAFALAAQSDSASFNTETQVVSRLTTWIASQLAGLPAGGCTA